MSKRSRLILIVAMAVVIPLGIVMAYYRAIFPYGQSHCCIILMSMALNRYAEENGARYPTGEASPEASLSLLYKSNDIDARILRGMTVPEKKVRIILEGGGLLGPDSCGWHYVPGLTQADDHRLALLWCKAALGHNGQRFKDGGRQVLFIGHDIRWISGDKWPAFLEEQKELLRHRSARAAAGLPLVTAIVELPDGSHLNEVHASYTMREESKGPSSSGTGTQSGILLGRSELIWYQAPLQDGYVTRTLSFSDLVSEPVTVTFAGGVPNVNDVIFKMRSK